jgi:hypothetical protein
LSPSPLLGLIVIFLLPRSSSCLFHFFSISSSNSSLPFWSYLFLSFWSLPFLIFISILSLFISLLLIIPLLFFSYFICSH